MPTAPDNLDDLLAAIARNIADNRKFIDALWDESPDPAAAADDPDEEREEQIEEDLFEEL